MHKLSIILVFLFAALLAVGCVYPLDDGSQETGDLVLHFSTRSDLVETKADGALNDGYKFRNLVVVVADGNNVVVQNSGLLENFTGVDVEEYPVTFQNLRVGNYHVYAYANVDQTAWQNTSETIAQNEQVLASGSVLNVDRLLKTFTGSYAPAVPDANTPMLLVGDKRIAVGVHANVGTIELVRPVVRLNVLVNNYTNKSLHVDALGFSDFNMSQSYLVGRVSDQGVPIIPAGAEPRPLPAYDPSSQGTIAGHASRQIYSCLLYESVAPSYRLYATITLDGETKKLSYKGADLISSSRILNMTVGETIPVMMVTPNFSESVFVGYSGSSIVFKQIAATTESAFRSFAEDILNSTDRDKYVLTLKRSASGWQLWHGEKNIIYEANLTVSGTRVSELQASRPNPDYSTDLTYGNPMSYANHLVKLMSGNYMLVPNKQNNVFSLALKNNSPNNGNRRWAFYEVDPEGSVMKLIDNETSQVTQLTQMVRNQELTVVLNVYQGVVNGSFDFYVVNDFWASGSTSEHTFH